MNYFSTLDDVLGPQWKVIRSVDQIHPHIRAGHLVGRPDVQIGDFTGCIRNGWEWIFPAASTLQPRFYACLARQNTEVIALQRSFVDPFGDEKVSVNLFLLIDGRLIQIDPWSAGYAICEIRQKNAWWDSVYSCMPDSIREVYYGRLDGMSMTGDVSFSRTSTYGLPSKMVTHVVFEDAIAGSNRKSIRALRGSLERILDGDAVESSKDPFRDFRFILDARLVNGDALFIQLGSRKKRVFHIHSGDSLSLRVVDRPDVLFDEYMSHILSFKSHAFDFMSHSAPIGTCF